MALYRYGGLALGPYTSFDRQLDIEVARYLARYPNFSRALQREMEDYLRAVAVADRGCCCHCSKCGRYLDNEDEEDEYEDEEVTPTTIKNAGSKKKETGPPPEPDFDPAHFDADLVKLHASYGGGRQRQATKKKVVQQYPRTKTTPVTYLEDNLKSDQILENPDQILIAARQQDFINEQLTLACTSGLLPPPDNGHTMSLAARAGVEQPVRQQRNRRYRASVDSNIAVEPCQVNHSQLDHNHQLDSGSTLPPSRDRNHRTSQDSPAFSPPDPKVKQKTRPGDRRDSVADVTPSNAHAANIPVTGPSKSQPIVAVQVFEASKELFLRMFGALPVNITGRSPVHFNDFVMAMLDAGFTVEHSGQCGGSGVNFKDNQCKYGGRNISFHRPHPDPKIHHHKLRTWGKRLQDKFGWSEESFQTGSAHA